MKRTTFETHTNNGKKEVSGLVSRYFGIYKCGQGVQIDRKSTGYNLIHLGTGLAPCPELDRQADARKIAAWLEDRFGDAWDNDDSTKLIEALGKGAGLEISRARSRIMLGLEPEQEDLALVAAGQEA